MMTLTSKDGTFHLSRMDKKFWLTEHYCMWQGPHSSKNPSTKMKENVLLFQNCTVSHISMNSNSHCIVSLKKEGGDDFLKQIIFCVTLFSCHLSFSPKNSLLEKTILDEGDFLMIGILNFKKLPIYLSLTSFP